MARINSAPSPKVFAETWSEDFKTAVANAAGKDGRLSVSEAKKIAKGTGPDPLFADNVSNYFAGTGKQTVSVEVLARDAKAYALRAAEVASGGDGKVSLEDGKKLPNDLKEDFFFLRGKSAAPVNNGGGTGGTLQQVKAAVEPMIDGLLMPSETDATFKFLSGPQLNGAPITADLVRQTLTAQHDAVFADVMWVDPGDLPLATRTFVEERNANDFLNDYTNEFDPADQASIDRAARFGQLHQVLDANLSDMKVFRFGQINISTFIVGRTQSGELAALLTGQVET